MSKLSMSVLDKIKKGEVKLKPRWQFVLAHVVLWSLVIGAVVFGSLVTGMVLREIVYTDWDFVPRLGVGPVRGFLFALPLVWIGTLGLMVMVSSWLFSKTKKGYRFRPWMLVLATIGISVVVGSGLFFSRVVERFDQVICSKFEPCAMINHHRDMMWLVPEAGILTGRIVEIKEETLWLVNDVTDKRWEVRVGEYEFVPEIGLPIVAAGEKVGPHEFVAEKVRIFKRGQMRLPGRFEN